MKYCAVLGVVTLGAVPAPATPSAWTAFVNAAAAVTSYTETVDAYEVAQGKPQRRRYSMYFRRPALVRAEIVNGDGAGSVAVWRGGDTVRAHRGGILAFVTLTLSQNDPRVVDRRGNAVWTPFFPAIVHEFEQAGSLSVSDADLDGVAVDAVIATPSDPARHDGVTKLALYLSKTTHLPLGRKAWIADELVEDVRFSDQRINVAVPDSKFSL
jgi:outer membrane lipoprotein-sorting protein